VRAGISAEGVELHVHFCSEIVFCSHEKLRHSHAIGSSRLESAVIDIYVVIVPGTLLLDLAAADAFRMANRAGANYRLHWVGPEAAAQVSVSGLLLQGIEPLPASLPADATVLIPSSDDRLSRYRLPQAQLAASWLRRVVRSTHRVCTICTGAFLAAQSGLLAGRHCTTHHLLTKTLAVEFPDLTVEEDRIFVQDGPIYSSAGATTGFDLALHLIAEDNGPMVALEVARELIVYFRRSGADIQLSPWLLHRNHVHPALHRAQDAVIREPAKRWELSNLAREAYTSPRHLARLFQEHAGISPMTYVRKIRMAAAKEIVKGSQHSLGRVAEMVGFSSGEQMRRAWRQFEGTTPLDELRRH
jgi:transcriptional regulator GlxA family with amidase domain